MAKSRARHPARQVLAQVRKELSKGWPPGLTVLTGDDLFHLDAAQKALLEALVPAEATDFALTVFGEDKVQIATVVGAARSVGMFAEQRVVFVRELGALDGDPDALVEFAGDPPASGYLIVRAPALDLRRKLHKALAGSGRTLEFSAPADPSGASEDIRALAKEKGLTLHPHALAFLAEVTRADLYRVSTEMEKLALLLGPDSKKTITLDLVRQVVSGSGLLSGWEVANAILLRDRAGALAAVRRLVDSGNEPIKIVGGLVWRARVMLQAKAMLDRGLPPKEVVRATRSWYFQDDLMKGLKSYTLQELLAVPAHLLEADRTLKSRSIGGRAVLETLVDRITRAWRESMSVTHERIAVLDFGSQYTQLITRRVRELGVYCEIFPPDASFDEAALRNLRGVILSGGPDSVYREGAPRARRELLELGLPVLGICYGMQWMMKELGAPVEQGEAHEYGPAEVRVVDPQSQLFRGLDSEQPVWASHADRVLEPAAGFRTSGTNESVPHAAVEDRERRLFGVQFHPEVNHTPHGQEILRNFVFEVCRCRGDWSMRSFIDEAVESIRLQVGDRRVLCALSGGVDSSVMALLIHRAIGERLQCIFVDNGALRQGEAKQVRRDFHDRYHLDVHFVQAGELFLRRLAGVDAPETKRKIIGETFIEVFEEAARELGDVEFLAQGTIYPDRIESASVRGPSATIKTHHNVGGLPERMHLQLVEPLRDLFKDEVRRVGRELGLDPGFVGRHPFPGPGLAVRILGAVTAERVALLQQADAIFIEELRRAELYDETAQAFVVLLPVKSVGVMGDGRTYEEVVALRAVTTTDFMTADWTRLPADFLARVSRRIVNEVRGVNRVVYDITSKPPGTIEWE